MKTQLLLYLVLAVGGLMLVGVPTFCGAVPRVVTVEAISEHSTRFPMGTVLVARQKQGHTLLWATTQKLHNARTGTEFAFPKGGFVCKHIVWSADQRRLLVVGDSTDYNAGAYVLEADSLCLVRHLKSSLAWWHGSHYAYLNAEAEPCQLFTEGSRVRTIPHYLQIYSADPEHGYLLCGRHLPRNRHDEEWRCAYLLQVWHQNTRGVLQRSRTLGKTHFDPGSTGTPDIFGMGSGRRVIFSYPQGGGAIYYLGVVEKRRMTPLYLKPHTQTAENTLVHLQGPYVGGRTLFGIAGPFRIDAQTREEHYLYQVSDKKIVLQKIGTDVAFTYHDPIRQAIGLGSPTPTDVAVRFIPLKAASRNHPLIGLSGQKRKG